MIESTHRAWRAPFACALPAGLFLVCASPALAQSTAASGSAPTLQGALGDPDGLTIKGTVRARYEAIDNQFRPGLDRNSDALLLQTDLQIEYDTGPVRVGTEITDSRAYGGGTGSSLSTTEVNALAVTQAYLAFDLGSALGAGSTTTFEAGRFTMDLGSRRLSARNSYRNTINAFTGFRADWKGAKGQKFTAFYTMPVVRLPDDQDGILDNDVHADSQSFDLTFWGAFASTPIAGGAATLETYFYGLDENDTPDTATTNRHLRTPGARLHRAAKAGTIDFDIEGAYQFGNVRASKSASAARLDVSAYFAHGELGYTFASGWAPRVAFELDVASGNKGGGSYNRFDTLYGARRFEFGPTSLYGALGRNNIRSIGLLASAKPSKRLALTGMYRAAWADSVDDSFASTKVSDTSGDVGRFAAHQIEARASYWLVPKVLQVEAGGAVLIDGDFLKHASGATGNGDTRYGYASATVHF
ncbi:alginate export family protein [Novosphingobium sp. 1949]|uniref:Alginate export family protein n=1 Tax=Novosphingobium organovorum TaxID=2930092 RepID=A0ABT0BAJ8_9SPHN|nr:alginate export family protein [Novosphingobium organovorum]MCJ2181974.1 alginate export family protein [Novosphingobium organovorum]